MTGGRLERALSEAIADLAGTSAPDYLDDILERTARTRQRPWWTFPGRYTAMTPTLKFATAATAAFALGIGASMLVLPQTGGPSIAPAAQEPSASPDPGFVLPFPPAEFTAEWQLGDRAPYDENVTATGERYEWTVTTTSDPRLDGAIVSTFQYPGVAGWPSHVSVFELANDAGSWISDPILTLEFEDRPPSSSTVVLSGDGEYQGLTAVAEITFIPEGTLSVRGIVSGVPVADAPVISRTE